MEDSRFRGNDGKKNLPKIREIIMWMG